MIFELHGQNGSGKFYRPQARGLSRGAERVVKRIAVFGFKSKKTARALLSAARAGRQELSAASSSCSCAGRCRSSLVFGLIIAVVMWWQAHPQP